ncbi:MAG TPA: hypothetical protein VJ901_13415 [Thermoanaerobaculia bacterium]|nr:hypothetical protein [Thermoanaerobaculia bacterium]
MAVADDYFLEIESHFAMRRGTVFILSAKDWVLMKKWADDGIPLPVVIEALDTVFEKAAERKKVVNSLSYCRHAVKELWEERKELQIGASTSVPEAGSGETLARLAEAIEHVSPSIALEIRALEKEQSARTIEDRLIEIERRLIAEIPELDAIRAEVAQELAGKVDEKNRARTEEAMLLRIVREKYSLPRLSLFG